MIIGFSSLAFLYIALRSYFIQITHDEAYSWFLVHTNYFKALATTANTHWVNSLFMKLTDLLGGNQMWMLRLHNVASFILYSYFLFRLAKMLRSFAGILALAAFFIINPYTLEYFSLARGYAISLTFITGAFLYSLRFLEQKTYEDKNILWATLCGSVAVLANYTALLPYFSIFGVLLWWEYLSRRNLRFLLKKNWIISILIFLGTCVIAATNLYLIKTVSDDLSYGGSNSYFSDTLNSIINNILHFSNISPAETINLPYFTPASLLLFLMLVSILAIAVWKRLHNIILPSVVMVCCFIISNIAFYGFSSPFPFGRTALTAFPSIALPIVLFIDYVGLNGKIKTIISVVIISGMTFLTVRSASLHKSYVWPFQAEVVQIMESIKTDQNSPENIRILSDNKVYSVWRNYYSIVEPVNYGFIWNQFNDSLLWCSHDKIRNATTNYDFLIVSEKYFTARPDSMAEFRLTRFFPLSGVRIYQINKPKE